MDFYDDDIKRKWVLDAGLKLASALSINNGHEKFGGPRELADYAQRIAGALWDLSAHL